MSVYAMLGHVRRLYFMLGQVNTCKFRLSGYERLGHVTTG